MPVTDLISMLVHFYKQNTTVAYVIIAGGTRTL